VKFFTDQDVYASTVRFLRDLGYDVTTADEAGMADATDEEHLFNSVEQGRIFVTRDGDFGNLVFVRRIGVGVIYLRIKPSTLDSVHRELERVVSGYALEDLLAAFVVVEPGRHRIRTIPANPKE
jgi:predicted nuclease of predicted toxin-antitoxin system